MTDARRREDMVRALLANLGRNPTPDAAATLTDLLSGNSLGSWRTEAEYQQQAQRRLLREASFTAARPVEVARVLCQGRPAHIADLQALVVDHLRCIESELRGDPAFQLRRFWQDDGRPRDEEDCRDILLALLRPRLERQQVDLQAESRAAAAKRMDLRASAISPAGRRFSLPIEAKKDNHREVWTACCRRSTPSTPVQQAGACTWCSGSGWIPDRHQKVGGRIPQPTWKHGSTRVCGSRIGPSWQ